MEGLRTPRVVVIDDRLDEAGPLLRVLATLGVPAQYFTGNQQELPAAPFAGIRLLFIDMILEGMDENKPKEAVSTVLAVLERILPSDARSAIPVIWTKHGGVVDEFKAGWRDRFAQLQHLPVIVLDDKIQMTESPDALREQIIKKLSVIQNLRLLWAWEELVHDAAADTTQELSKLVEPVEDKWFAGLTKLLAALAHAEGGQMATDSQGAVRSLFGALDKIFEDRLEAAALTRKAAQQSESTAGEELAAIVKSGDKALSGEALAALNRLLLLELITEGDKEPLSGNI